MSDVDPLPSSPGGGGHIEKSFMTAVTEDDNDSKMANATPEPSEKHPRGKKRGRAADREDRDNPNANVVGKVRHLKKEDGEPLWRVDIQYDFLKAVFDNDLKVFTSSYGTKEKLCFADLYIETMARSTKTSKVLHDKLLSDREAAKGMAMVCLLVNIGRMNTTLNCKNSFPFPRSPICDEMHADTFDSFPRDASTASNIPRDSISTSTTRCPRIQTATGRATSQIDSERRSRRSTGA
jgi:hypothetical protein